MESRMGSTYLMDHRDVHVSSSQSYTTSFDIQTMDPTQATGGRDRSRESSKAKRDDRHLKRGEYLLLVWWHVLTTDGTQVRKEMYVGSRWVGCAHRLHYTDLRSA